MTWVAAGIVLVTSLLFLVRLGRMTALIREPLPPARVRRRITRQGMFAVGLWQCSIAFFESIEGVWSMSVTLWLSGIALMIGPWYAQKFLTALEK